MTSMVKWPIDFFHVQQYRCCAQYFVASAIASALFFAFVIGWCPHVFSCMLCSG